LNWQPYQSLQEVNASNNADSEVQPLAAQAKVPRPAKHDDAGACYNALRSSGDRSKRDVFKDAKTSS
jgi:hypothetical protein